jgi:MFS family permease
MSLSSEARKVERSLKYSVYDGAAYSAMVGLTQEYIAPFALALKATSTQIGLLASIPALAMSLSQLKTPALVRRIGSRKRLILVVVLLQALMWLPLFFVPYVFSSHGVLLLIAFFALCQVFGSLGNPAWGSWMADLVVERRRGRYFGRRMQACGFTTLAFTLIAGLILYLLTGQVFLGFAAIFIGAMAFRLISWHFLTKVHEPPFKVADKENSGLLDFIKRMRTSNVGRFIISVSLMNFAVSIAAPFFAVYMLRDLGFSYLTYMVVIASSTLASALSFSFWGRWTDRVGNVKVLLMTSFLIPLVPLLWIASHNLYYLIPIQLLSGFAWAGFNLCSANFLYDASPRERKMRDISYFNAINGTAICLGALLGGLLAPHLPPLLGYSLLTLFLLSGLMRAVVAATILRQVKEVRRVRKVSTLELLRGTLGLQRFKIWHAYSSLFTPLSLWGHKGTYMFRQSLALPCEVPQIERSPPCWDAPLIM